MAILERVVINRFALIVVAALLQAILMSWKTYGLWACTTDERKHEQEGTVFKWHVNTIGHPGDFIKISPDSQISTVLTKDPRQNTFPNPVCDGQMCKNR